MADPEPIDMDAIVQELATVSIGFDDTLRFNFWNIPFRGDYRVVITDKSAALTFNKRIRFPEGRRRRRTR